MIRLPHFLFACFANLIFSGFCFAQNNESMGCNLNAAPTNAVRKSAGSALPTLSFPDPETVPPNYSGCLNLWSEAGVRIVEAKFEKGAIRWYRLGDNEVYCEYENNRPTKEMLSDAARKARDQLPPEIRTQIPMCPPGEFLVPSMWNSQSKPPNPASQPTPANGRG